MASIDHRMRTHTSSRTTDLMSDGIWTFWVTFGAPQGDRAKLTQHLRNLSDALPSVAADETIFDYYLDERSAGACVCAFVGGPWNALA